MKRSPLVRKSPLRRKDGPAHEQGEHPRAKEAKPPKDKVCKHCRNRFTPSPSHPLIAHCSFACGVALAEANEKKKERAKHKAVEEAKKAERKSDAARKEAMKSIADLIADAQTAFNSFVRARDRHKGCISCGRPFPPQKPGGSFDAGHFISRGHATHLRFDEDNCFGQCKGCNRPGGATRAQVTAGVLARIGPERLAAVEGNYEVHKWTREELTAIKNEYRAKRKELEKNKA